MQRARTTLDYALALLPGAAAALLSFQAGGFFPDSWTVVACVLALLLVLRITLSQRPFAGLSTPLIVALGALALFTVWVLVSGWWSDAPGRATIEYSRVLTYLLMLLLLGSTPWDRRRVNVAIVGILVGLGIVVGAGLVARLRPDLLIASEGIDPRRMAWPVTYWNGLGLVAAVAIVLALHVASWTGAARTMRPVGAAALPMLAVALYLTLSRGAIVALVLGLAVYVVIGRPRALICALLAAGPPTVFALLAAYHAPSLLGYDATLPGTIADGRHVANEVLLASLAAGALRALLLPLDTWLSRWRAPSWNVPTKAAVAAGVVALGAIAVFATGSGAWARTQADTLLRGSAVRDDDIRTRLLTFDNDGRFAHWQVSLNAFEARPLIGSGAGTYEIDWKRERTTPAQVVDAHSLFVETLGELGLVGIALLLVALGALVIGASWRARGPERPLYAAVLAATLTWAAHAALDWSWELTGVTIWMFGLAGVALAARPDAGVVARPLGRLPRIVLALGCLVLLLVPVNVYRSQHALRVAIAAYQDRDCNRSIDSALSAIDALPARADPWELLAYCDIRAGQTQLALRAARESVRLDPRAWDRHYAVALALAADRQDPRAAAREAARLNPLEPLTRNAVEVFSRGDRKTWRRDALRMYVPVR